MELMIIAALLLGVFIGVVCTKLRTSGTLRIDHSNPEKDIYRLDIPDLDSLDKKRCIVLNVDHNAHLSQQ